MNAFRSFCNTLLVSILLTIVACGGDAPPETVAYQNTTLIVNGTRYERQEVPTNSGEYVPHDVLVGFKPSRLEEGVRLLKDLNLQPTSTLTSLEMVLVNVPAGFEAQWVAALISFDVVQNAARNVVMTANAVPESGTPPSVP